MALIDLYNAALADARNGSFAAAEKKLRRLLKMKPTPAEEVSVLGLLGAVHGSTGRHDAAVRALEQATKLAPTDPTLLLNLCVSLSRVGRYDDAVETGRRAVAANPADPDAHYNLGQALKSQGAMADAIGSFEAALTIREDYAPAHNGLGNVYMDRGDLDMAIASFENAIRHRPGYAIAFNNLGIAQREAGESDKAIASFRASIDLDPGSHFAHNHLGNVYRDLKDWNAALACFRKALELNPDSSEIRENIGHVFSDMGDFRNAIEQYEIANTEQSRAEILRCLYALGEYDAFQSRERKYRKLDRLNLRTAAMCYFTYGQLSLENPHPFCPDPLQFIRRSRLEQHVEDPDAFVAQLISDIRNMPSIWDPNDATTRHGFQTRENLLAVEGTSFPGLEDIFRSELDAYREEYADSDCLLLAKWPRNYALNAHAVRLQNQGHQSAHIHAAGWISGVIYLNLVESEDPDEGAILFTPDGYDLPKLVDDFPTRLHRPAVGDIVLFPSSLFHKTIPIQNDGERIIIAFDMMPR